MIRQSKKRNKETLDTKTKKTVKSLVITLTLMVTALSFTFLYITSENAQQGYTLQQEKLKNEHLKTIKSTLNTKITESTAFTNIEEKEALIPMTEIEEKTYITAEDNNVK